jgi:hypothetical protein
MNENLYKLIDELDYQKQINKIFSSYLYYYNYYSCNVESYYRINLFKDYIMNNIDLFIETLINENNHCSMMNTFIEKFIDSDPQLYGFQISTSDFLDYFKPVIEELKLSDPSYAWEKCSEETKENLNF